MRPLSLALLLGAIALLAAIACGSSTDTDEDAAPRPPPTATGAAPVQQPPTPTVPPTAAVEQPATPPDTPSANELAPAQDQTPEPTQPGEARGGATITIGDGTLARYVIGEQLANRDLPNDAIGETPNVSGSIVFDGDGNVLSEQSTLVVDVSTLESDSGRRDNYLRDNSLQTATFREATLVVTDVVNLPWPLPESGEATFMLIGDFTVRDVTKQVEWEVTAQFGPEISGQAVTVFTFDYFEMSKPRLAFILSLDDEIRLEIDFVASLTP